MGLTISAMPLYSDQALVSLYDLIEKEGGSPWRSPAYH